MSVGYMGRDLGFEGMCVSRDGEEMEVLLGRVG